MNQWFKQKWNTKKGYIISLLVLISGSILAGTYKGASLTPATIGIFIGTITAYLVLFGPIIYVDVKNIKIGKPKNIFVEPSQLKLGLFYIVALMLSLTLVTLVYLILFFSGVKLFDDTEGIAGSGIIMFSTLFVLFSPITVYMLNAKMRYKRIVEYKTTEWKRLQK